MTNQLFFSKSFKREAKRLVKKYSTLNISINNLGEQLLLNPFMGSPYGSDIYKIRLADKSKGRGKSGSFRVLYFHLRKTSEGIDIVLMFIYDKSEKSTVLKTDALKRLNEILKEEDF